MTASPRFLFSRFDFVRALFLTIAGLGATLLCSPSTQAEDVPLRTTLVVFTDHPMSNQLWALLIQELHRSQAKEAVTVPLLAGDFDVLPGDKTVPELNAETVLSISVVGECSLIPGPRRFVEGALGWVREVKGQIQPFIHISCERIVNMLGPIALGMNHSRRDTVTAEAMARVIVHEWIHIATQKAGHARNGVMQSRFELWDLLADDTQMNPRQERHCKKESCGM